MKPGDSCLVQLPDGRKAKIQIPASAKPGETLTLQVQQRAPAPTGGPLPPSKVLKGSDSAVATSKSQNDNKGTNTPPADESSKPATSAPENPSKSESKKKSKSQSKKRSRKKRKSESTTELPPSPFVNIAVGLGALASFVVAGVLLWSAASDGNTTNSNRRSSS